MYLTVKIAKFFMSVMPGKPVYNPNYFQQEMFRHPSFKKLNDEEKKREMIQLVKLECRRQQLRPFELFYPDFPFKNFCINKTVLDVGCSIGGLTIDFAEKWQPKAMYGVDVDEESIMAANAFVQQNNNLKTYFEFKCGYGEKLPFDDETFDAIISHDTIEHVRDVAQTLKELKRVTKKNGLIFLAFPSYKYPFGGAHLGSVTQTPFLEWFFSPDTLNKAYLELQSQWSNEYNWFKHKSDLKYGKWEKVEGGIGINGITYKKFNAFLDSVGFTKIEFIRIPLLHPSNFISKHPSLRFIPKLIKRLLEISPFIDYLSQRLVYILTV